MSGKRVFDSHDFLVLFAAVASPFTEVLFCLCIKL